MNNKIRNTLVSALGGTMLIAGIGACSTTVEEKPAKPAQSAEKDVQKPEKAPKEAAPAPEKEAPQDTAPDETVSQQQAVLSAESYVSMGGFSKAGLIDQLKFEGFTQADAEYAVNNVDVDWNEQAVVSAEGYMEMGGFSRASLIDQLVFEKFTQAQAEYAVNQVGL